jgi:HK97 family phage major capsid protein
MKIVFIKPYMNHAAGAIVEIIDEVIAKSIIDHGYAKAAETDPIDAAIGLSVEALTSRIDAALKKTLDQLTTAQQKSRKNGIPEIFGPNGKGDPKRTFGNFLIALRTGDKKTLDNLGSEWEPWTKVALGENQGATGGFLVPTEHYDSLMMYAIDASIMRKYAFVLPQGAKETEVPCLDVVSVPTGGNNAMLGGVVFNWTEEAASEVDAFTINPLKMLRLINYELTGYTYLSNTLMEDTQGASLESIILMLFGTGIGWTEDYAFFRGTGAGKPLGVVAWNGLISVTRSGASAFALADYAAMMSRLIPTANMSKCFWACHPTVLAKLYAMVATSTMYVGNFQETPGGRMLGGLPVHVTDKLPALNTAGDILLCDGSGYIIGDRRRIAIAYSEGPRFTNNQTTWRVVHRVAGRPWATDKTTLPDATSTVGPFIALAAG